MNDASSDTVHVHRKILPDRTKRKTKVILAEMRACERSLWPTIEMKERETESVCTLIKVQLYSFVGESG